MDVGVELFGQVVILPANRPFQEPEVDVPLGGPALVGRGRQHPDIEVGAVLDVGVVLESEDMATILFVDGGRPRGTVLDADELPR